MTFGRAAAAFAAEACAKGVRNSTARSMRIDSIAQGAAERSPGLRASNTGEAPTWRDSPCGGLESGSRNLGPLGLVAPCRRRPRAAPAQPAPPWAIESRPVRGFLASNECRYILVIEPYFLSSP